MSLAHMSRLNMFTISVASENKHAQTYRQNCELTSSLSGSSKEILTLPGVLLTMDPVLYVSALFAVLLCCFFTGSTLPPADDMMTEVPGLRIGTPSVWSSRSMAFDSHVLEPIPREFFVAFPSECKRVSRSPRLRSRVFRRR